MSIKSVLKYLQVVSPFFCIISAIQRKANNSKGFSWGFLEDEELDVLIAYEDDLKALGQLVDVNVEFHEDLFTEEVRKELIIKLNLLTKKPVPNLNKIELEFLGQDECMEYDDVKDMNDEEMTFCGGDILSYQGRWITYGRILEMFMNFRAHPDFASLCELKIDDNNPNRIVFDVTHG
jgi:hypothetical protein